MALILSRERSDGTNVTFWVADLRTLFINISANTSGDVTLTGSILLRGYLNEAAILAGKTCADVVTFSDLTQDECGDLFKKVGKDNMRKEIYKTLNDPE